MHLDLHKIHISMKLPIYSVSEKSLGACARKVFATCWTWWRPTHTQNTSGDIRDISVMWSQDRPTLHSRRSTVHSLMSLPM